jgi:hypothetical protein
MVGNKMSVVEEELHETIALRDAKIMRLEADLARSIAFAAASGRAWTTATTASPSTCARIWAQDRARRGVESSLQELDATIVSIDGKPIRPHLGRDGSVASEYTWVTQYRNDTWDCSQCRADDCEHTRARRAVLGLAVPSRAGLLAQVQSCGTSTVEDLPGLVDSNGAPVEGEPGFSGRVAEALACAER